MDKNEHVTYWLNSAEHDLDAAESLFAAQKYDWALFLGHLVLEKALKAMFVHDNENSLPPRIHNLVRLIKHTSLEVDEETLVWLDQVNDFNLETRYPDYRQEFYKACTGEFAQTHFGRIKEMFIWVKSHLK